MSVKELRQRDDAQNYLLQGLWLQRVVHPSAATVRSALEWALEIAANGQPLPPIGFVADLGHYALALDREAKAPREIRIVPGWTREIAPRYEDYVLGKIYADWTFERAGDALRRYQGNERERDKRRGLAYIVKQIRDRGQFTGVELPPGLIRGMLDEKPEEVMARGWESFSNGLMPLLHDTYEEIISASRRMAEVLDLADVIALEQRTALAEMGQYVAHRQVLQMAQRLEDELPRQRVRPLAGRQEVPTRILDEDTYPVGGFSSISTKGSIESLLHSQLAYMEPDNSSGPDLFDIKYLRDELYYYSRDENQFLRRRRTFLFVLWPDLVQARFKDADLPCQRIVLTLALLLVLVRKMSDWLSTDALIFEFVLCGEGLPGDTALTDIHQPQPLKHEWELIQTILREQIENGSVVLSALPTKQALIKHCGYRAQRSLCHCLIAGTKKVDLQAENTIVEHLTIGSGRPTLSVNADPPLVIEGDDALEHWTNTTEKLLQLWI